MADERVTSNGNVTVWWVPSAGLSDYLAPTAAEINAGINLTEAIAWDGFELAAAESNDVDDRSIADIGNAVTRGFQQFAASMNFFRDVDPGDTTSPYVQAFETFRTPRVYGYLITRVLQAPVGDEASDGEWVSVFRFVTGAIGDDTEGEDSYKMTVGFLPQGEVKVYTQVVGDPDAPLTISGPSTVSAEEGDIVAIHAELRDKDITQGATWRSSDTTVASVSANGVVIAHADGEATITATHPTTTSSGSVGVEVGVV